MQTAQNEKSSRSDNNNLGRNFFAKKGNFLAFAEVGEAVGAIPDKLVESARSSRREDLSQSSSIS